MVAVRISSWIIRIAGVGALLLGLLSWIIGMNLIPFHMLFGITLTLSFLILSIILVCSRGTRMQGGIGIVYALLVLVFGVTQSGLLTGDLHWLIQTAHLLVGVGAMGLAGGFTKRLKSSEQISGATTTQPQAAQ